MIGEGYAVSFRLGAPGDAGMVPLSLRETAKGGKKMIQLAALKQVSSFFQRSHPRAKRKPDPRIKALPGGSSPLWDGGAKSEVMAAGRYCCAEAHRCGMADRSGGVTAGRKFIAGLCNV